MDILPELKIGDLAPFAYGEICHRAIVYDGKITGIKREETVNKNIPRDIILEDLIAVATEASKGKKIQLVIESSKDGAFRLRTVMLDSLKSGRG